MAEHDISAKGMRHVGLSCGSEGANTGGDESGNDSDRSGGVPEITVSALSADTLAALTAHLAVKDAIKAQEGNSKTAAASALVTEDFGLSQFWYDDETQKAMAREVLKGAAGGKAAIISAPSVMNGIQSLKSDGWSFGEGGAATVFLFEFDRRFDAAYPDSFVYYDYNEPSAVPDNLKGSVDYVLMDPPYLNDACVEKFLETAQIIARRPRKGETPPQDGQQRRREEEGGEVTPMMFITSPLNHALLREKMGLRRTPFELGFKSKFATPMSLYTNHFSQDLGGWVEEEDDLS